MRIRSRNAFYSSLFLFALISVAIALPGRSSAATPGIYDSELGPAELKIEGARFVLHFRELADFLIEGTVGGTCTVTTLDGSVGASWVDRPDGQFAITGAGDALEFTLLEQAPDGIIDDVSATSESATTDAPPPPSITTATKAADGDPVRDEYGGYAFRCPKGWKAKQGRAGWTIRSAASGVSIIVMAHTMNSRTELRESLRAGLHSAEDGTALSLDGDLESFGESGAASRFRGTLRGENVEAYNVALLAPGSGGVSILATADPSQFDEEIRGKVRAIAASVSFIKKTVHPEVSKWNSRLAGGRFSQVESDFSSSSNLSGQMTGSGYLIERHLDLCSDGSYRFQSSSDYSVNAAAAGVAGGASTDSKQGRWDIDFVQGHVVLNLHDSTGESFAHLLGVSGDQILFNGVGLDPNGRAACGW